MSFHWSDWATDCCYFSFLSSWSSRLVTCLICQRGSTAPSKTMWRRRGISRTDTSSACLLPSRTSSLSHGTKVRMERAKGGEVTGCHGWMWLRGVLLIYVKNFIMIFFILLVLNPFYTFPPFFSSPLCLTVALYIVCSSSLADMFRPEG